MKLALAFSMVTVVPLLISQLASPLIVSQDPLRSVRDYFACSGHTANDVILINVFLLRFVACASCTLAVRNDIEGFHDTPTVKEAFLVLYVCFILAYSLSPGTTITLITVRLLAALVMLGVILSLVRISASCLSARWLCEEPRSELDSTANKFLTTSSAMDKTSCFPNQSQTSPKVYDYSHSSDQDV